jgi:Zn-dependent protease
MDLARIPTKETQPLVAQKQKPYEYTITYAPIETKIRGIHFSRTEIKHLTAASLLVIGVGLSWVGFSNILQTSYGYDYVMLALFATIFTASFFTHEIAHKIAAQRKGLWAEFRLTLMGAILTMLSILPLFFKIISPGAVMIAGFADRENIGKISIAGPATNLTLSTILLAFAFLLPQHPPMLMLGAAFNAWIALFNLIPFGILDGFKIFLWNKKIWALAFTASLALTLISYSVI